MTTLKKLQREGADTIFLANSTQWGLAPYPKLGLAYPQPREQTIWKKRGSRKPDDCGMLHHAQILAV